MENKTPQERYAKKTIIQIVVKLNKNTNKYLIDKMNSINNKQGYIKELIESDSTIFKKYLKQKMILSEQPTKLNT